MTKQKLVYDIYFSIEVHIDGIFAQRIEKQKLLMMLLRIWIKESSYFR